MRGLSRGLAGPAAFGSQTSARLRGDPFGGIRKLLPRPRLECQEPETARAVVVVVARIRAERAGLGAATSSVTPCTSPRTRLDSEHSASAMG
ncbi:unnamed protein product [Lampetra planeri]